MGLLAGLLDDNGKDYFYLTHLNWTRHSEERRRLWEFAKSKNIIGIDQHDPVNVNKKWLDLPRSTRERLTVEWRCQFELFAGIELDDAIVVAGGQTHLLGIGLADGQSTYAFTTRWENEFFRHVRSVRWLEARSWDEIIPLEIPGFENTIRRVGKDHPLFPKVDRKFDGTYHIPTKVKKRGERRKHSLALKYPHTGKAKITKL